MRPFISPARIVLLALIDMYCSNAIQQEDDDFVVQLIGSFLVDTCARPSNRRQRHLARWQRAYLNVDLISRLRTLRKPLQGCRAVPNEGGLPTGSTLWDDLVSRLWLSFKTLDDMVPFFEETLVNHVALTYTQHRKLREQGYDIDSDGEELDQDSNDDEGNGEGKGEDEKQKKTPSVRLDRRTPMGQLIYQASIEFARLSFSGRCELWEDFVRYRHPSLDDFQKLWPSLDSLDTDTMTVDPLLFDINLVEGREDWGDGADAIARVVFERMANDDSVPASSDETEKLVALLTDRERNGFRPDQVLREQVDKTLSGTPIITAQATYYRLLDAWRVGDINTAYSQLHRYFDLVARQGVGATHGYHMGPMTKAILQRDFGEHPDDLLSMLDAVNAGREARAYGSLRFSLLWLYLYARMLPRHIRPHHLQGLAGRPTDGEQVLPYIRLEASAVGDDAHHAISSLLEARVSLGNGRPLLHAKKCIVDGSRIIMHHNEHTLQGQLMSTSMVFWDRLGHGPLAVVHGKAFMCTRQDDVPFEDAVRVASRLAEQYGHNGRYTEAKDVFMALSREGMTSLKPQSMQRHVLTFVAATQAVRAHDFDEADDLLLRRLPTGGYPTTTRRPSSSADAQQTIGTISALHGSAAARTIAANEGKTEGPSRVDPDLAAQAALLRVESLARRRDGSLPAARDALDAFENSYDKGVGDLHIVLRMALVRSQLYAQAGESMRIFTFMIRTIQACLRQRYHLLLWQAVGAMARLLVAEGEFRAARQLLDVVIPRSLETGYAEVTAILYQDLCDAYMGLAGQHNENKETEAGRAKMKQCLSKAWWSLGQALVHFQAAGSGDAVKSEVTMKRKVIFSVAQQLEGQPTEKA